jgi:dihydrofolate reductase
MSNVVLYVAASLDGFIARENGSVDWLDPYQKPGEDYGYAGFYRSVGATIMGANTYRQVKEFGRWPYGDTVNYVISTVMMDQPKGGRVNYYYGDLAGLVREAGAQTRKDIWLVGGAQVTQEFWRLGLIDEIFLTIIPVMLGSGLPLFDTTGREADLQLRHNANYRNGVVQMRYKVKKPAVPDSLPD